MIDPVSAFALATAAYNAVKQGIEVGREMQDVSKALGTFFKASTDIKEAAEQKSKPSIFRSILDQGSVEQEALDNLVRRRTIIKQEYELMMLIKMRYGDAAYNEMLEERRRISVERIKAEKAQIAHKKQVIENIFMYSILVILLYVFYLIIIAAYSLI